MKSSIRMLKRPTSFVLASLRPSTLKRSFSEVGSSGGAFPFAKIYSKGERPTRSAVCISSVLHSLRPCWMALLSILWGNFTLSWMCTPSKFCRVNTTSWQPPLSTLLRFAALVLAGLVLAPVVEAADRDKLLSEPGVYGTFAAFRLDTDWAKRDQASRIVQLAVLKGVVEQHREKLAIDVYLLRGLSDYADLLFRVHATELRETQQFFLDLQGTSFGKHLISSTVFSGLTKKANYVPGMPDNLKAELKTPSEPGPRPYVIVIPIRKDADWWSLSQEQRAAMMQEHTEASLPYHKTVKRKLYHATGLDDLDFITYFETSRLEDFQSLILALEKVKEYRHNRRFGHPTLLGTVRSLDEIIEVLAQ